VVHRFALLSNLLDGVEVSRVLETQSPTRFWILPVLFAAAAIAICFQYVRRRPPSRELRAGAVCVVVAVTTVLFAAVTPGAVGGHHVIAAYPFPQFVLALVIARAAQWSASRLPLRPSAAFASVAVALTAIPTSLALTTTVGMLASFRSTGGLWSSKIYGLDRYLQRRHPMDTVVTADWGISLDLDTLSQGRLRVRDLAFTLRAPGDPKEEVGRAARDRDPWFLLHSKADTVFHAARTRFFEGVRELHGHVVLVNRFEDHDRRPLFEVYRVAGATRSGGRASSNQSYRSGEP
jgi:hypothetical protein